MKKIILILGIIMNLTFVISKGYSQIKVGEDLLLPPDYNKTIITQAKPYIIPIMDLQGENIIGTGFIVNNKDNIDSFVITNAHIVKACYKKQLEGKENFNIEGKEIISRFDKIEGDGSINVRLKVVFYNENIDISILVITRKTEEPKRPFKNTPASYDMLASTNDVIEGKQVVFMGYPLRIGKEFQNAPVSRLGMIAQVSNPDSDYFLIDATASHGNSGSPVFGLKGDKFIILGMLRASKADRIYSYDEEGNVILALPYNSGLAEVIKLDIIKKFIEQIKYK